MSRARIAHFSGPNATIQNSPPLVTSNKARKKFDLPLPYVKHTVAPYYFRRPDLGMSEKDFVACCVAELEALIAHARLWSPVANTFTRPVNLEMSLA